MTNETTTITRNATLASAMLDRCMLDKKGEENTIDAERWNWLVEDLAEDLLRDLADQDRECREMFRHYDPRDWKDAQAQHKGASTMDYLEWLNYHHDEILRDLELANDGREEEQKAIRQSHAAILALQEAFREFERAEALGIPGPSLADLADLAGALPDLSDIVEGMKV